MLFLLALAHAVRAPRDPLTGPALDETCTDIHNCRLLFDILWGCLTTIFACTWVSVHPNVPPPPPSRPPRDAPFWRQLIWRIKSAVGSLLRRLKLMLAAVIAPELMVRLAGDQLTIARAFAKKYDVSLTHGFFICMGGFVDAHGHPLVTSEQLKTPGCIEAIQKISESAIEDKSKGDALSKGVAFCQTLWFVVQCIARTSQHLPLTEIEVATLAFAVVNVFIWVLWWAKPLDVQDPIVIHIPANPDVTGGLATISRGSLRKTLRAILVGVPYSALLFDPRNAEAVPSFWYGSEDDDEELGSFKSLPIAGQFLLGAVFGSIHCAAWKAQFPSVYELYLWRYSSAVIAGLPVGLFALAMAGSLVSSLCRDRWPNIEEILESITFRMFVGFGVVYVLARLVLLAVAFSTLRSLPAAVFADVDWTVYIPHL
ncbi:hypothetical protein MKEN_00542200 [Mycena kentingensis (nom. inval.)]|nr:hypothetical protein MKEN_00542200 [Mycena kentingensis (nom. inval.)]